jgi:hypothetical protein
MATAPGIERAPLLRWWCRCVPDSHTAQVALKDQQKMALVKHPYWESTLSLTLSLSDFGNLFYPLARQRRAPNTKDFFF